MNITGLVNRFFDRYVVVARLFPALIFIAPIFVAAIVVFPKLLSGYRNSGALGLAAVGALYFVSSLARSRGKIVEHDLIARWGGWPTTILLRHRDQTIDPKSKARYHSALEKMLGETLPGEADERADPTNSDHAYRSATKLLLERRRGKQHARVHEENASFGFRRNLLGLKRPAITIAMVCVIGTVVAWTLINQSVNIETVWASLIAKPIMPGLVLGDMVYVIALLWGVNDRFVRQAGNEYALALFRTLEVPARGHGPQKRDSIHRLSLTPTKRS